MDALERLRRADPVPAPGRPSWEAVAARLEAEASRPARPPRPVRARRTLVVAMLLLLLVAGGAVAAGILLSGEPVPEPTPRPTPHSGTGTASPARVRLLPLTAADPDGGPPWGIRLVRTTRGLACLQLGRRSGGRLGVLGRDGAFQNDGRFHAISARAPDPGDCSLPDSPTRPRFAMVWNRLPASGLRIGCQPPVRNPGYARVPCPAGSERDVYYGLLGSDAMSVTYEHRGRLVTTRTTGPDGAYLIVLRSARRGPIAFTASAGPHRGLTSVQYRDGRRCVISPPEGGGRQCSPAEARPRPARGAAFSHVAIRATVRPIASGRRVAVRFRAPATIRGARRVYVLTLALPVTRACALTGGGKDGPIAGSDPRTGWTAAYAVTNRDIAAGAPVRFDVLLPSDCRGTARGRVDLNRLGGGNPDPVAAIGTPGRTVGRFSLRLPGG